MTRPRCCYRIKFCPRAHYFRPPEVPQHELEVITLTPEEAEALRLKNIRGLDQTQSARQMGVSQSTFQRVLASAYRKISEAIVYGKAIEIMRATPT